MFKGLTAFVNKMNVLNAFFESFTKRHSTSCFPLRPGPLILPLSPRNKRPTIAGFYTFVQAVQGWILAITAAGRPAAGLRDHAVNFRPVITARHRR
jgi:hypothetical protein